MAVVLQLRKLMSWQVLGASMSLAAVRSISVTSCVKLKRPVFEGPTPPKKPVGPFLLFVEEKGKDLEVPQGSVVEKMKALGSLWKGLSESEQKVYRSKYDKSKEEYEITYQNFLTQHFETEEEREAYKKSLKDHARKRKEYLKNYRLKKSGLLMPHKKSAFNMYMKEQLSGNKEVKDEKERKDAVSVASKNWASLTEEQKAEYEKKALKLNEKELGEFHARRKEAIAKGMKLDPTPEELQLKKVEKKKKPKAKKTAAKKTTTKKGTKKKGTSIEKTAKTASAEKKEAVAKSSMEENDINDDDGFFDSEDADDPFSSSDEEEEQS